MNRHIISTRSSILDALRALNALSGQVMTLFVVDEGGVMCGTLTDGDIRRGFLAGALPSSPVTEVMHRQFRAVTAGEVDLEAVRRMRHEGIALIPRLDSQGRIAGIIDTRQTSTLLPLRALLMAGGKGERLRPLTLTTPKPLLKVGERPIIDYNVIALAEVGITDITVSVGYMAQTLISHFEKPIAGVKVKCIEEDRPLGTIGAASLLPYSPQAPHKATLVMNSDLLTSISFEDFYLKHQAEGADITIAAIPYNLSVPYAVLTTEGQRVTGLEEKPSYAYYANAGIYIIADRLLAALPHDRRTDATDLIERAIADGAHVAYFPISGTWIDIGSPADYRHACELMHHSDNFSSRH
ncbi:MAG: NTP transferase domain-containing protein [Bacteroidales bacterium]|nr:NTP transferase domain-containing protein [Bacteroidales bacterium]